MLADDDPASPSHMTLVRLDAAETTNSQSSKSGSRSGAAPSGVHTLFVVLDVALLMLLMSIFMLVMLIFMLLVLILTLLMLIFMLLMLI